MSKEFIQRHFTVKCVQQAFLPPPTLALRKEDKWKESASVKVVSLRTAEEENKTMSLLFTLDPPS